MRFLTVFRLVAVVATVAAVWHSGPRQVYACSCGGPTTDEQTIAAVQEARYVVDATIESVEPSGDAYTATARVNYEYKGEGNKSVVFAQSARFSGTAPSCEYGIGESGSRHLLWLLEFEGQIAADGCLSLVLPVTTETWNASYLTRLERVAPPRPIAGLPRAGSGTTGDSVARPLWPAVAAGLVVSTAILAIGARRWLR